MLQIKIDVVELITHRGDPALQIIPRRDVVNHKTMRGVLDVRGGSCMLFFNRNQKILGRADGDTVLAYAINQDDFLTEPGRRRPVCFVVLPGNPF